MLYTHGFDQARTGRPSGAAPQQQRTKPKNNSDITSNAAGDTVAYLKQILAKSAILIASIIATYLLTTTYGPGVQMATSLAEIKWLCAEIESELVEQRAEQTVWIKEIDQKFAGMKDEQAVGFKEIDQKYAGMKDQLTMLNRKTALTATIVSVEVGGLVSVGVLLAGASKFLSDDDNRRKLAQLLSDSVDSQQSKKSSSGSKMTEFKKRD